MEGPFGFKMAVLNSPTQGADLKSSMAFPTSLYLQNPDADHRDVTEVVKEFYEETPFPNYDRIDSRQVLEAKARSGYFAALLDDQLPARFAGV